MTIAAILSVVLAISAACYLLLGVRVCSGAREAGRLPLGLVLGLVGIWVLGGAIEQMATTETVFSIGRMGHWLGTALIPVLLLICFRQHTGAETPGSVIAALLIVPMCSIVIAATNNYHELMWLLPAIDGDGGFLARPRAWGVWFLFVHAPFGYAMTGASILTLLLQSNAVARSDRRGLFLLANSALAPIIACIAYDLGIAPASYSLLPLVFAVMLPIYAWLIIGEQIVEFSPLAYETVFQNMQDPVIVLDDQRRIIGLNHGAEDLLDMKQTQALRESLDSVFGTAIPEVYEALETGKPQKIMTNTGRFLHLQVSPISTNKAISKSGRVLMFRDVSDVEKAQKEVRSSEKLLRTLVNHSVNGIMRLRWVNDEDGKASLRCIFANSAAANFLNTAADDIIDLDGSQIMLLASNAMETSESEGLRQQFENAIRQENSLDTECLVKGSSGSQWLRIIAEPVGDDMAVTLVDITDRKAKELQMESIASSDPLTGVLNRRGFERDAAKRLTNSDDEATGALMFIDLDNFKHVNDSHGHEVGDQLLTIAARRLRTSLRSCDIIGRPGGDEFVALVPDVTADLAEDMANRLTSALEKPYLIGSDRLSCAASIGFALYPKTANTLTGLMRAADQAMYRAKARCQGLEIAAASERLEKAV